MFPTLKQQLFEAGPRAGYSQLRVVFGHIRPTIYAHPEYRTYIQAMAELFGQWQASNVPHLESLGMGSHPKQLIEVLSEDLLRVFTEVRLIDKYDIYQHLMSYWTDTMQDDVYMIALDGWKASSDLIPTQLIIHRYLAADQQIIESLEAAREGSTRQMEEMDEEQGGEGGLLEETKNEKGKITKVSVRARLKDIFTDLDSEDERTILNAYLDLLEQETEARKKVKDAHEKLDAKVVAKYKTLSEDEVKTLVVDDKWLNTLMYDIQAELNHISQALTGRINELAERYATPLPRLSEEVEVLSSKVDAHLKKMGFVWQ